MVGRRTHVDIVLVAGLLLLEILRANLAFEVALVAVLAGLML